MAKHIFFDNSNIFGGAQRAAGTAEPGAIWPAVRIYYRNLFRLLEGGDQVGTRVLAGSVPPGNEQLWEAARKHGYDTDLLRRIEQDDGRLAEQAVDEMLHLKIANALLDHTPPQTLLIATGDGHISTYGTSFPTHAERAITRGWSVEVWSWSAQLSGHYAALARAYPGSIHVQALDTCYFGVTFVKPGSYMMGKTAIWIAGRIVSPLRPPTRQVA